MLLKVEGSDIWDPTTWVEDEYEHRIYGRADLSIYAVVDAKYYPHLCQYRWSVHDYKKTKHLYLRRAMHEMLEPTNGRRRVSEFTGREVRDIRRVQRNLFLHTAVMLLTGIPQPTPEHDEVDHINRRVWDCREENLRWATRKEQAQNSRRGVTVWFDPETVRRFG